MKLSIKTQAIDKISAQALIIGLFEKAKSPRTGADVEALADSVSDMVAIDGFQARLGEVTRVLRPMGLAAR